MAQLPGTPRTWTDGEVVTEAMFDQEISGSMRYLKGLLGPVTYSDAVKNTRQGVGLATAGLLAPQARLDVRESADAYAAIVENAKASGTPHGLQVASNLSGSHRILSAGIRNGDGSYTEKFAIAGDGTLVYKGRPAWRSPIQQQPSGAMLVPFTATAVPGWSFSIDAAGWWMICLHMYIQKLLNNDNLCLVTVTGPGMPAKSIGLANIGADGSGWYPTSRANAGAASSAHHTNRLARYFSGPGTVTVSVKEQVDSSGLTYQLHQTHSMMTAWYMGD